MFWDFLNWKGKWGFSAFTPKEVFRWKIACLTHFNQKITCAWVGGGGDEGSRLMMSHTHRGWKEGGGVMPVMWTCRGFLGAGAQHPPLPDTYDRKHEGYCQVLWVLLISTKLEQYFILYYSTNSHATHKTFELRNQGYRKLVDPLLQNNELYLPVSGCESQSGNIDTWVNIKEWRISLWWLVCKIVALS